MTRTRQFQAVFAVLLIGLFLAPAQLQAQDDHPYPGVWRIAYDVAPRLLNGGEIQKLLKEIDPSRLRDSGTSGTVVLYLYVDSIGRVTQVRPRSPSPEPEFNQAADSVVRAMRFTPATVAEEPISVWMMQRVDFDTR